MYEALRAAAGDEPDFQNDVIVFVFDVFPVLRTYFWCICAFVCLYALVHTPLASVCIACMSCFQYKQIIFVHNIRIIIVG